MFHGLLVNLHGVALLLVCECLHTVGVSRLKGSRMSTCTIPRQGGTMTAYYPQSGKKACGLRIAGRWARGSSIAVRESAHRHHI